MEDCRGRIRRQVTGHEAQLHQRAQAEFDHPVIDAIHLAEIYGPVLVDGELVQEDAVRAHSLSAKLLARYRKGPGKLGADVEALLIDAS